MGPVTEQSEHLSSAQIENYGNRTSGAGPDAAQGDERQRVNHQSIDDQSVDDQSGDDQSMNDQRVEAHLTDCASCRNRLLDFHRRRFALMPDPAPADATSSISGLADSQSRGARLTDSALADSNFANSKYPADPQVRTAPTPECPSDDALRQLAAGLTPDDVATKLTQHAATCDHCGPLLRTFTEDFSDDFSPEERSVLNNLQSASDAWQKNTAREMLQTAGVSAAETRDVDKESSQQEFSKKAATTKGTTATISGRKPFSWKWVPAFSFVLLLAAGATWVYPLLILHYKGLAVEAEYRKGRPMKYRPSGVPYGPYERELGGGRNAPTIEVPYPERAPLLAANAALLRENGYTEAKSILENALGKERPLPLLNNLAVAYAMEAEDMRPVNDHDKEAQKNIYKKALEITGKILERSPSDPAALFNQALILERLGNTKDAITTLKQLSQVEQDEGWREDAAEELRRIQPMR